MNTTQLESFVGVATELSFSKAAQSLHLSQPTVSHQVSSLEDELGTQLLTRSTRSVRLTEDGVSFLGYAQEILELEARGRRMLAHGRRRGDHALRIGVHDGLEARLVAPSLRALRKEVPDLSPLLRMGPSGALREMLRDGAIDVLLEHRDPDGPRDSATTFRLVRECPAACVCAPDHPLAERPSLRLEDLTQGGCMAVGEPRRSPGAIVELQRRAGAHVAPQNVMMAYNAEIALALASAGVAFTVQADIPAMHVPALVHVPLGGLESVGFGVRVRRGRRAGLVDHFIDAFAECLDREPDWGADR